MGKDDKATGLEKGTSISMLVCFIQIELTSSGVDLKYCKRLDNVETGLSYSASLKR